LKPAAHTDAWGLVDYYLSPIAALFNEPGVTEISVNRFDQVFVEKDGLFRESGERFPDEQHLRTLISQIANALGQVADKNTHPVLDGRLRDGSRVCAVLEPTATRGACLSIRLFPREAISPHYLIEKESLSPEMMVYLETAVLCRANILVSGGTDSGKTTLLNVLASFIPAEDRLITVEDTRELKIGLKNHIALESPQRRKQTQDGQGMDMAFLIKTCLRLNPTRILIGEIRDAAAAKAFLHAINTGHSGTMTSLHANSPEDALVRLQVLTAGEGALPLELVRMQVRRNIDVLVHTELTPRQGRRVVEIAELSEGELNQLWRWSYTEGRHLREAQESRMEIKAKCYGI
jgi:pilus assembly protein CpaF